VARQDNQLSAHPLPAVIPACAAVAAARRRAGLSTGEVATRSHLPTSYVDALERGDPGSFPDPLSALQSLRLVALALGLEADRVAMSALEAWAPAPPAPPAEPAPPTDLRLSPLAQAATSGRRHPQHRRKRRPLPQRAFPASGLRRAIRLSATCLGASLVALAVVELRPAGILFHQDRPVAAATPPSRPDHRRAWVYADWDSSTMTLSYAGAGAATYRVPAPSFTVIVRTTAPCWTWVTEAGQSTPLVGSVLPAGAERAFTTRHRVTLRVGAGGVVVQVRVGDRTVGRWHPPAAPFNLTLAPA
jgi:hypothetical protein